MKHKDFKIGTEFTNETKQIWRCTDVGTRIIVAMKIGPMIAVRRDTKLIVLTTEEAEQEGWFNGPPYALLESVFDEDGMVTCRPTNKGELSDG